MALGMSKYTGSIRQHCPFNVFNERFGPFHQVDQSLGLEGRITATDAPQELLSQLEGYEYEFR